MLALFLYLSENESQNTIETVSREDDLVMVFQEKEHDFGNVKQNEAVQTVFEFTNAGKTPLKIANVKSNCECIILSSCNKQLIMPGEKSGVIIEVDTKKARGTIEELVTIYSDAQESIATIVVKANIHNKIDSL